MMVMEGSNMSEAEYELKAIMHSAYVSNDPSMKIVQILIPSSVYFETKGAIWQ